MQQEQLMIQVDISIVPVVTSDAKDAMQHSREYC